MKRLFLSVVLGAFLVSGVGCGDAFEITAQPLAGQIGGQTWTFVSGHTDSFLSDEQDFFAVLYAEVVDPCGFGPSQASHLIVSIPTSPGTYDLSLQRTMTFVDYGNGSPDNLITTDGTLRVDEITAETVSGGIHSKFDGGNEVDGEFVVVICAE